MLESDYKYTKIDGDKIVVDAYYLDAKAATDLFIELSHRIAKVNHDKASQYART